MQVWVMAENAKTDRDRTVPMCEEMLRIFEEQGILKGNPEHYVVTGRSKPGPNRFGTNFLSKRFGKVRDAAGFTQDSTLYAFKHTRVIHLKLDGAPDPDIMALTGHTSFHAYSDYLRDLGMDVDPKEINKYTRAM
jgi:integrase